MKLNKDGFLKLSFFILLFSFCSQLAGQTLTIRVFDTESEQPLPFVNVLFDLSIRGTTTNIDGFFSLNASEVDSISLSYVGYAKQHLAVADLKDGAKLNMQPISGNQKEMELVPGENPAERIIQGVVKNKELHRPRNLDSYRYRSYDKLTLSLTDETRKLFLESLGENPDSSKLKLKKVVDQQNLFLLESVSDKVYQNPKKEKEEVIASRVSGMEDPSFFLLATQLQSFTFYRDYIKLFEKEYLSPISPNSWNKYLFVLEETWQTTSHDTLFMIRFRPRNGKNLEGLQGVLAINSDGYAIESLRVEGAANNSGKVKLSIGQIYDKLPTGEWFPKSINSEILFSGLNIPGSGFPPNSINIQALGKTYLSNRFVNIPIAKEIFQGPELSVKSSAAHQSNDKWAAIRSVPLSTRDSSIYQFTDSLGQRIDLGAKIYALESLADWRFPIGKVDILLDRVLGLNKFEGLQLGAGLETNPKFSEKFTVGGYWRYGLKDHRDKYGGNIRLRLDSTSNAHVFFHYENDIKEDGKIEFLEQKEPFISRQMDVWYRSNFTYHEMFQVGIEGRIFPSLLAKAYWKNYKINNPTYVDDLNLHQSVDYNLIGGQFRLTFKERLFRQRGEVYSLGGRFPVLHVNYERAVKSASDRPYQAIEFKLSDSYKIRNLGESEFVLIGSSRHSGGIMNLLASPPFSRPQFFSFYSKSTFATMRINEFVTDQLLALFWRHNFGSLLFKYKKVHPDILLAFNAGIGSSEYDDQLDFANYYPSIPKGYYEGGVLISRLLKVGFLKLGTGAFYRMGPYRFNSFKSNLALEFTIDLAI